MMPYEAQEGIKKAFWLIMRVYTHVIQSKRFLV